MDPALQEQLLAHLDRSEEVEAILRLKAAGQLPAKARAISEFGPVVTCRIRRADIREVYRSPLKASLKAARFLENAGALFPGYSRQPAAEQAMGEGSGPSGKGVVIGIIDWGFDFAHPSLRHPDGSTRLLALWDQSGPGALLPYGYGALYRKDEIDDALQTEWPYLALGYHPAKGDPMGIGAHGTHVASIAAGSNTGSARGIAPEAGLVCVHLAARDTEGAANLGDSVRILEALDFIRHMAAGRPLAINMSVGRHGGPHDGCTLVEQAMDYFLESRPDTVICQSTGNYFQSKAHHSGSVPQGGAAAFSFRVDAADTTPNELEVWYPGADRLEMELINRNTGDSFLSEAGRLTSVEIGGQVIGRIYHRTNEPNTGKNHINLFLYTNAPSGSWEVRLIGQQVSDGRYHAWIERDGGCRACQSRFEDPYNDPTTTTGTICNGRNTIVAGAYDSTYHQFRMAPFSSSGPTVDGRPKPDLVAPGMNIRAARSTAAGREVATALYTQMSGTSMAAPHVTGACALLLEILPRGTPFDVIRQLVLRPATAVNAPAEAARMGRGILNIKGSIRLAMEWARQHRPTNRRPMETIWQPTEHKSLADIVAFTDERILDEGSELDLLSLAARFRQGEKALSAESAMPAFPGQNAAWATEHFEIVLEPGEQVGESLRGGDILEVRAKGEGIVFQSMLADGYLHPPGQGQQPEGGYATVIESWPQRRPLSDMFRRRITGPEGRLLSEFRVLRLKEADPPFSEMLLREEMVAESPETGGSFKKVKLHEVEYLALEGGGGKGMVFLGAIEALEAGKVLQYANGKLIPGQQIKGISGASAGAITAVALSVGYDSKGIRELLKFNFNEFFDLPGIPAKTPAIGVDCNTNPLSSLVKGTAASQGMWAKLLALWPFYTRNLLKEFGMFPGCRARQFFDDLIVRKAGSQYRNMTFRQHYELFKIELVLTGANLEKGTSEFFSHKTTPNLPVADAARISMSLPFLFKPYRIGPDMLRKLNFSAEEKKLLRGVWVDGGLWNNIPIRAFGASREPNPKTLGIRLTHPKTQKIKNFGDYIMAFLLNHVLGGSGEVAVSQTSGVAEQIIILNTGEIDVTDFNPPGTVVEKLIKEAQAAVVEYFLDQ